MKVTFLTVMPSPYVQDLFAAMACDDRFDLRVLYMEQEAPDTYWGEQVMPDYAEVLPGRWVGVGGARVHINPGITRKLDTIEADLVVIVGYIGLTNQLAMRHLTRAGRPWCFWGEIPGFRQRGLAGQKIRSLLQRPLRYTSGIAGVGSRAVDAYQKLLIGFGERTVPVHNVPYYCDLTHFENPKSSAVCGVGPVEFLYCGQLIERKGVDVLLEAFSDLVGSGKEARLVLAGEGPLRTELEQSLPPYAREHVHFLGFQPVSTLPDLFSRADVFVLPSRHDGWGVVINQALASALPVIATSNVGAAHDLVNNGLNGFVIPSCSRQDLHQALRHFVHSRGDLLSFSENSRVAASRLSLDCAVQQWSEFLSASIQHFHRKSEPAK